EPTFEQQKEITVELTRDNDTNKGVESYRNFRVGAVDFKLTLRRGFNGSMDYNAKVQCQKRGGFDPHWSLKFEVAYRMTIPATEQVIAGSSTFDSTADHKAFNLGPFEAPADSHTEASIWISIKLLKWSGIHHPLAFDFSRRSNLSDATLIVEGRRIYITKSIVAMQSAYFKRLFDEESHAEFKIPGTKYEDMIIFLTLMYPHTTSDQISQLLTDPTAPDSKKTVHIDRLLDLAARFESPSVSSIIEKALMEGSYDTEVLLLADKYCLSHLCSQQLKEFQTR
ncbi:hypothetical protein PENTCL1PPCAC_22316, partial [Pristionchus entomophagus]